MSASDTDWHLDKRVPLALVVMILGQVAFAGYYVATDSARSTAVESDVERVQRRIERFDIERDETRDRLTRLELQLAEISRTLTTIATRLAPDRAAINNDVKTR